MMSLADTIPIIDTMKITVSTTPISLVAAMYFWTSLSSSWPQSKGIPCAFVSKSLSTGTGTSSLLSHDTAWIFCKYLTLSHLVVDSQILLYMQKLREVQSSLCRSVICGILSNSSSFLGKLYLPRGDSVVDFESPNRERSTALLPGLMSLCDGDESPRVCLSEKNNSFIEVNQYDSLLPVRISFGYFFRFQTAKLESSPNFPSIQQLVT